MATLHYAEVSTLHRVRFRFRFQSQLPITGMGLEPESVSRSVNEPLGITNFVHIIYFPGNRSLLRVLPQIYAENKEPVQSRVSDLVRLLPNCESAERNSLLQLLSMIARDRPNVSDMTLLLKSRIIHLSRWHIADLMVLLHWGRANAKMTSLSDGLLQNSMCYLHWVQAKSKRNFKV